MVDLFLGFAVDEQRDSFGELVLRAAVEGDELLSIEFKRAGENTAFRARAVVSIAQGMKNF